MTDANLVRVLQRQTTRKVGLVPFDVVRQGPDAIRAQDCGPARGRLCLCRHGRARGRGSAPAGYGLRRFGPADRRLGHRHGPARELPPRADCCEAGQDADLLPEIVGGEVVLAGSCSAATLEQVAVMAALRPDLRLDPDRLAAGWQPAEAVAWARQRLARWSGADLRECHARGGRAGPGPAGPRACRKPGRARAGRDRHGLVAAGARRLVVAGGETSGAVVQALGVKGLAIGPMIDPGVPATVSIGRTPPLALALKSGNFGGPDFFLRAFTRMPGHRDN